MEFITGLFMGLGKLIGTAGFGTIFGGVMGLFNRKADLELKRLEFQDKKDERNNQLLMKDKDALIMDKEWAGRLKVAEVEGASQTEVAAFNALAASYKFAEPEKGTKMMAFSSFIRPFISIGYFIISSTGTCLILYYAFYIYDIKLTTEQLYEVVMFVISWFAFMAGATIGWWFAMRPGGSMPMLNLRR